MKRRFLVSLLTCLTLVFGAGLSACNENNASKNPNSEQNNSATQSGNEEQSSPNEEVEIPVVVGTEGLLYEKIEGKDEYAFTGFGSITGGDIVIASHINGLPVTTIENRYSIIYKSDMTITIPHTVTTIANRAFYMCKGLTNINIPDSVTSIGESVFPLTFTLQYNEKDNGKYLGNENNPYLYFAEVDSREITSFTIDETCKFVAERAFYDCEGLTSIEIPDSVVSIGEDAFYNCSTLQYNEKDGAKYLGNRNTPYLYLAGAVSSDITNLTVAETCKFIGSRAFEDCDSLTSVTLPATVTYISSYAFYDCNNLTSITLPDAVTAIGDYAFLNCNSLASVTLGNAITSIGAEVFRNCEQLTSITIPVSVTSIGYGVFYWCHLLETINYGGTVEQWAALKKGTSWNHAIMATEISCKDGVTPIL